MSRDCGYAKLTTEIVLTVYNGLWFTAALERNGDATLWL